MYLMLSQKGDLLKSKKRFYSLFLEHQPLRKSPDPGLLSAICNPLQQCVDSDTPGV